MRAGSLFSGYGGLDMAVAEVLGAETAWVSDIEAGPRAILAHRYPGVPNLGDITAANWSRVEPVDVIAGGSPCQDVSTAGRGAGMRPGTRSGLWASMCDAISVLRPSYVVWENVRGALSASASSAGDMVTGSGRVGDRAGRPVLRAAGRVLGDLASLGYDAAWCGLRAADVGAPHARYRVFVLAWPADSAGDTGRLGDRDGRAATDADHIRRAGTGWPRVGWPGPEDCSSGADAGRLLSTPTAQLAANRGSQHPAKRVAGGHQPTLADEVEHLLPTPTTDPERPQGRKRLRERGAPLAGPAGASLGEVFGAASAIEQRDNALLLPTPTAVPYGHQRSLSPGAVARPSLDTLAARDRFGAYGPAVDRWGRVLGRPAPDPTELPATAGGRRRLAGQFVEWMMGVPDGWVTGVPGISRSQALRALGNGVVPQQAAAALRRLLAVRAEAWEAAA